VGYIKEPKGVDLIIPPSKLTREEAAEIADFIRKYKLKNKEADVKKISKVIIHK